MQSTSRIMAFATLALLLSGCAGVGKRPGGAEVVEMPIEVILGQLEVALHDIDGLPAWGKLKARHDVLSKRCKALSKAASLDEERMCTGDIDAIAAACGCNESACSATASEVCAISIERSQLACNFAKAQDAEIADCKYAAAHKVPKLKQAEVTLQVVHERTSSVGLNVLLFKAGGTRARTGGQSVTFVLTPKPRLTNSESSAETEALKRAQDAAESMRRDLLATVEASLKAMALDQFDVPNHMGIKPSVAPDELKFVAEIVAKDSGSFGLEWKATSGAGGLSGGGGATQTGGNKVTLVFKR